MRAMLSTIGLLALFAAVPALAQQGPSFECSKAANAVERTVCREPALAADDRKLAAVYARLIDMLEGPAREHAQKDQARWVINRSRACTDGSTEIVRCLKQRYDIRTAFLETVAAGPYPFVSEQAIVKSGKVKAVRYNIDASYPQFDGTWANFKETNLFFAEIAKTGAADTVPDSGADADRDQTWSYDLNFAIYRPGQQALSVVLRDYSFTGGAHGSGGVTGTLVDLKSGYMLAPSDLFAPGDGWRQSLREMVVADLKKQFVERPGFDDALEPAKMDKMLRETRHYIWRPEGLAVAFNQYDIAAGVMGPYVVRISYDRLRPLLRPDAPVGN